MFLVPGTVRRMTGTVFAGSGHCSRRLPLFSQGLDRALGYQPFMGSLNLCLADDADLGVPHINWVARHGNQVRDYQFWRAWIDELTCHAMVPGKRNHGPDVIEMVAPFRLRDHMGLVDGSKVAVDVELGS
jgi:riboflavin kinase